MRTKVLIIILFIVAILIVVGAFVLLNNENSSLKNVSFVYNENQFIATYENEPVTASFLLVDSGEYFKTANENSAKLELITYNNDKLSVDSYTIKTLERASILSSYGLYKITVNFNPKISSNEHIEFTSLQINENKYDIGTLTVQNCVEGNYPNIGIGTSPFSENPDIFTVMISNRESEPVTISEISYILGGNKINWLESNVNVEGKKETDIVIQTGFKGKNYTVRPIIVYEYKGKQYKDIAAVATEYTTSLNKKEILDYVKKDRK